MPSYGKSNFKESNINYFNKDFASLKQSLMNYAKSYFPDTYRDFNETSPGMMLLEMNAYVGDVLSFYIDQQYREMILPLSEERRNILNMAKMFGYKVKPIVPSFVDLSFTSEVTASNNHDSVIYSDGGIFDPGLELNSDSDGDITFTTLEPIDFTISSSIDTNIIGSVNAAGLARTYTLKRTVRAVSATEKTLTFQIGAPEKFKNLIIPDTNVVDIVSCKDNNGNDWYEVDFLAQDKVPISTHYTDDYARSSAYVSETGLRASTAVPYSLQYIHTSKRFTRETNPDNTTSLVFGNGVLNNGQLIDQSFIDMEQIGIIVPGQSNDLNQAINPLLGDEYSTLGETPNNITLTITYRVGGGVNSNVPVGNITTLPNTAAQNGNTNASLTSVTNETPARGGRDEEPIEQIKENIKAFFSTQNRCVTKEDYEARIMNIPSKYGNVSKVYVTRSADAANEVVTGQQEVDEATAALVGNVDSIRSATGNIQAAYSAFNGDGQAAGDVGLYNAQVNAMLFSLYSALDGPVGPAPDYSQTSMEQRLDVLQTYTVPGVELSGISIYVLGYNSSKQLVGNPHSNMLQTNDSLPQTLFSNINNYLSNFRLMTDALSLHDGYIVNFGVFFDVIAEKYADKQEVKLRCIQKVKDYFNIDKMQFNQPIFKSNLEYELMGIEGVRSIGHVTLTQQNDYNDPNTSPFSNPTFTYSFSPAAESGVDINGDGVNDGIFQVASGGTTGYGYKYDFENAQSDDGTIIMPPNIATPTVFELKKPNNNIQGRVR